MAFKFIKTTDPENALDLSNVTFEIPVHDIPHNILAEQFTEFLKACGYGLDGYYVLYKESDESAE